MKRLFLFLVVVGLLGAGGFWLAGKPDSRDSESVHQKENAPLKIGRATGGDQPRVYKEFSGEEFMRLALSIKYPNVRFFEEAPELTGSKAADDRIRSIAEARGYVLTSIPVSAIQKIDGKYVAGDDLLQPLAAVGWEKLKELAAVDGIPLALTSAYRSPAYQRDLFLKRMLANGASISQLAAGGGEAAVTATLKTAALPGYSRHHSGYTIDLWCDDGSGQFLTSRCFQWMKADNYAKPKQAGWIPSYPEGAGKQGPEPEPWEYIWVGEANLLQ